MDSEKEQQVTSAHGIESNCISYCSDDKNNGTTNIHNFTKVSTTIIVEEEGSEETEQNQQKEEQQGGEEASTEITCPSNTTVDSKAIRSNHAQSVRSTNLSLGVEEGTGNTKAYGKTISLQQLNHHASDISGAWGILFTDDTIPDLKNIMRNYEMHCKKWSWLTMQFEKIVDEGKKKLSFPCIYFEMFK